MHTFGKDSSEFYAAAELSQAESFFLAVSLLKIRALWIIFRRKVFERIAAQPLVR